MKEVTQDEFYAALKAIDADIMPNINEHTDRAIWKYVRTGKIFGVSYPGWKNPGDAKSYHIVS